MNRRTTAEVAGLMAAEADLAGDVAVAEVAAEAEAEAVVVVVEAVVVVVEAHHHQVVLAVAAVARVGASVNLATLRIPSGIPTVRFAKWSTFWRCGLGG